MEIGAAISGIEYRCNVIILLVRIQARLLLECHRTDSE